MRDADFSDRRGWALIVTIIVLSVLILLQAGVRASAHDVGCDQSPVPTEIKSSCCGKADYHRLDPSQISEDDAGYIVTDGGHVFHISRDKALPSPDGCPAIFYAPTALSPSVYCFFLGMAL
jgi:hypothetical protein